MAEPLKTPATPAGAHIANKGISISDDAALYLDFYGDLLTRRQADILDMHYNEDYSLSEIARGLGISKQAAHDALKGGIASLTEYEKKLGLVRACKGETADIRGALAGIRDVCGRIRARDAAGGLRAQTEEIEFNLRRIETALNI